MSIRLDDGIPIPRKSLGETYPFTSLKGNKSFLVPKSVVKSHSSYRNLVSALHGSAKRRGVEITVRKIMEGKDKGCVRVWRKQCLK